MTTPAKIGAVVCLTVAAFVAGTVANRPSAAPISSSRQILKWACPMHPQYTSDRPGDAPCCGMRLEPVYADSQAGPPDALLPKGAVRISAGQQQLIGVRTDEVKRASASLLLRVPGRIAVDEARLYRIVAAADGWIRKLGDNSAGTFVKQNEIVASYYVPNLLAIQQGLVYAMRATDPTKAEVQMASQQPAYIPPTSLTLLASLDSLRNLGMSDFQVEEFKRTRVMASEIHVYSPVNGFVIARNISPGQRFEKGSEMYRIADIGHVWVMTDIFEKDREFVKPGAMARVHYQGRELHARMSDALPQFDPQTRTLKTRFDLDNPGYILRPDMFVDVEIEVNMPAALTVPADAVIDSGLKKTVYVDRGNGHFEPRRIETGWRLGDRVQITKGLDAGEHIVVSGNFLIDSESRMRLTPVSAAAVAEKTAAEKDPVCGMDVDPKNPKAIKTEYGGKTYYFCSDHCKKSFEADPGKYVPKQKKAGKQAAHDAQGVRAPA